MSVLERALMIGKCIRKGCQNIFEDLSRGRVYSLERRSVGKTEFFWICAECEPKFAVTVSLDGEVDVVPRKLCPERLRPNPLADLRPLSARFERRAA